MIIGIAAKGFIGAVAGVFGYLAGRLNEVIIILALLMVMDYILGIAAVFMQEKRFDPTLALKGAFKKALYSFVIVLGYLGDYLIIYMSQGFDTDIPGKAVMGLAVTLYLIGTEGFSICKNLIFVGVPVPDWFIRFFGLVKNQAGKIVPIPKDDENETVGN
jgi:toxin secretion/phage lysis holin